MQPVDFGIANEFLLHRVAFHTTSETHANVRLMDAADGPVHHLALATVCCGDLMQLKEFRVWLIACCVHALYSSEILHLVRNFPFGFLPTTSVGPFV